MNEDRLIEINFRSKPCKNNSMICVNEENPLALTPLTLSPQSRGEVAGRSQRASVVAIRNPSLSRVKILSPQGWGEGTGVLRE